MAAEVTLEQFETLVFSQQPATHPWAPCTPYDFESRKQVEGKHPELIRDVFRANRICDAGMGEGHLVHLLRDLGLCAFGFDISRRNTCYGDLTAPSVTGMWQPKNAFGYGPYSFDLVICREVLEHLTVRGIRHAVANICTLSSCYVYVTTRYNEQPQSPWDVQTSDDLDPTHISLLPKDLLRALFVLEGFKRRADLEQRMDWQQKGRCLVYERAN